MQLPPARRAETSDLPPPINIIRRLFLEDVDGVFHSEGTEDALQRDILRGP